MKISVIFTRKSVPENENRFGSLYGFFLHCYKGRGCTFLNFRIKHQTAADGQRTTAGGQVNR